jgi:hypothetical protein
MFLAVKVLRIDDSLREGWLDGKKKWMSSFGTDEFPWN